MQRERLNARKDQKEAEKVTERVFQNPIQS